MGFNQVSEQHTVQWASVNRLIKHSEPVWHGSGRQFHCSYCIGASFLYSSLSLSQPAASPVKPEILAPPAPEQYPSYSERKKQEREIWLRATVIYSDLRGDCQAEPELAEAVPNRSLISRLAKRLHLSIMHG